MLLKRILWRIDRGASIGLVLCLFALKSMFRSPCPIDPIESMSRFAKLAGLVLCLFVCLNQQGASV